MLTVFSWRSTVRSRERPFDTDVLEAQLNNVMMRSAKEVNVVTDSSKLGRRSVSKIGPLTESGA